MKLDHIWIALAAGLGSLLPLPSSAVVVWFSNQEITIPNDFAGVSVDLESGATSTSLNGVSGGDVNFFFGGTSISNDGYYLATTATWQVVRTGSNNSDPIQNLTTSATIGTGVGALTPNSYTTTNGFGASTTHLGTQFTDETSGYIGFSLVLDNSQTAYGWVRVTLNDNGTGTLHEWAFDDSGVDIQVGAVPEAATSLLLLAAGCALLRRRRV